MHGDTLTEKGAVPVLGVVIELFRDDEVARCNLLFQAANGTDRDEVFNAEGFQGVDIGTGVNL